MTTDKEELRNVINDSLFGFKDEEYGFTQAETAILIKVEKLLEAKDKEIADKDARYKDLSGALRFKCDELEERYRQIIDLKAEIEKYEKERH